MEYWRKIGGECGTVDDGGYVPDSEMISKSVYDQYISDLPVVEPVIRIVEFKDIETGKLYQMRRIVEG